MNREKYSVFDHSYCGSTVYGLKIQAENNYAREYPFISFNQGEVHSLIRQMEAGNISPVHYDDIVSDFLQFLYQKKLQYNGLID